MKKTILFMIFLLFPFMAHSEVIIITDKEGVIYSVSENDDTIIPAEYKKTVIKGKMAEVVPDSRSLDEYSFDGKKFKVDAKSVKAKEDKQLEQEQKIEERKAKKQSAVNKLKVLGLTEEEIAAFAGKD